MPLVNTIEVFARARRTKYAVFSVVGGNLEMALGPLQAAETRRAPLILVFSPGLVPAVRIELGIPMLANLARRASVPVVVALLNQAGDIELTRRALDSGASSIMFNGSALPYDENIAATGKTVALAHKAGACVEGKLGSVAKVKAAGRDDDPAATMTDPDAASDFVARTGCDSLAISFGNAYGMYAQDAALDTARVRQIRAKVDVALVMHGGSGLVPEQYRTLIDCGITRFCYYTAMAKAASRGQKQLLEEAGAEAVYHRQIAAAIVHFREETERLIELLGCGGTAD
jgi:ketose-bisphosphate aldolase